MACGDASYCVAMAFDDDQWRNIRALITFFCFVLGTGHLPTSASSINRKQPKTVDRKQSIKIISIIPANSRLAFNNNLLLPTAYPAH